MRIGVPSEIKIHEYRVGLMPASVRELTLYKPVLDLLSKILGWALVDLGYVQDVVR